MEVSNKSTILQISGRVSSLEKSLQVSCCMLHPPLHMQGERANAGFRCQAWALNLPLDWHFNSDNFVKHVNQLTSPISTVSLSAFCFTFAHALAESSQFYLQSAASLLGEVDNVTTARRQSQAVDNLIITLDAIGDIGRHSPQSKSMLRDTSRWLGGTLTWRFSWTLV